jgi:hypothetical protein
MDSQLPKTLRASRGCHHCRKVGATVSERLTIPAARIAEVADAALVCHQTVARYRDGLHLLRATEAAITRAARELPADKQLVFSSAQQVLDHYLPDPPKPAPVAKLASIPKRPRVTIIMPEEATP